MEAQTLDLNIGPGHEHYKSFQKFKVRVTETYTDQTLKNWHERHSRMVRNGLVPDEKFEQAKAKLMTNVAMCLRSKQHLKDVPDLPPMLLERAYKAEIRGMKRQIDTHIERSDETSRQEEWYDKLHVYEAVTIELCRQYHEYPFPPLTDEETYHTLGLPEPVNKRPRIGDSQRLEAYEDVPNLHNPTGMHALEGAARLEKKDSDEAFWEQCRNKYDVITATEDLPAFDAVFSASASTGNTAEVTAVQGSVTHDTVWEARENEREESTEHEYDHDDLGSDSDSVLERKDDPNEYETSPWENKAGSPNPGDLQDENQDEHGILPL